MPDEQPPVTEQAIHECIDPFIDLCQMFTLDPPSKDMDISTIMDGVLRKNIKRIRAIHLLVDGSHELSSVAYEVVRNMIEDVVSVEYVQLPDHSDDVEMEMEMLVERFFDFQWIQLKQDLDYYRQIGIPTRADFPEKITNIESRSAAMIAKYQGGRGFTDGEQLAHSWIRKSVERLLSEIQTVFPDDGGKAEFLARAYIQGNRNTHFSPDSILRELQLDDDKFHGRSQTIDAYEAFLIAGLCMVWILRAHLDSTAKAWIDFELIESKLSEVDNYLSYCIANVSKLPHDHAR